MCILCLVARPESETFPAELIDDKSSHSTITFPTHRDEAFKLRKKSGTSQAFKISIPLIVDRPAGEEECKSERLLTFQIFFCTIADANNSWNKTSDDIQGGH